MAVAVPARRARTHQRRTARYWAILLLPSLVLLIPFFIAPLVTMLAYSVYRFVAGGQIVSTVTLENYSEFFGDAFYRGILVDTLLMGVVVAALALVLSFPLAFTIARSSSRWRSVLTIVVLVPLMTSVVVRSYGWTILLADNGVFTNALNGVLGVFGVPRVSLMYNFAGTVIALTEVLMPFMVMTLVGVIGQIDRALEDSVRSLGGGRWRVFRDVIFPLSLPGIAAGALLVFVLSISAFATPKLIGGATTKVMATLVYDRATTTLNWPFASAVSFSLVALVLLLVVLQGRMLGATRAWADR